MSATILVPIDGSTESYATLEYSFALFPDSSHVALYVIDPAKEWYEGPGFSEDWETQARRRADQIHDTAKEAAERSGRDLETVTEQGEPYREILEYAEKHDVAHVCLGSTGRASIQNLLLGGVAETVTRRSPTPVTVVRNVDRDAVTAPQRVLVAVDGSDQSRRALEYAVTELPAANVTAIHVPTTVPGYAGEGGEGTYVEAAADDARREAQELLDELCEQVPDGDAIDTAVEFGTPARTITDYARANDVDHIVVGSRGRSGLSRILLGSVAETVVRRSPVPVTVVR